MKILVQSVSFVKTELLIVSAVLRSLTMIMLVYNLIISPVLLDIYEIYFPLVAKMLGDSCGECPGRSQSGELARV